ncbi:MULTISPECIES: type II toxin-antitoxin system Phd/YefM family antitoxin [Desulfonatronum]|uniref:type II toxin-antitoxin system Phd/YefM family antitoxin n=1 Tax=Desulfonatronum TaxID=66848 RepID=UPI0004ABD48D|nr:MULTISPECIES: type II toxin-antitoxin system Phd/YefM family antitoxin [Desulfonatronum]PTN34436.1 type II toxin-antitoxin system Phd/YefM family antitoxin [Desulfonatronum sp. SC1]
MQTWQLQEAKAKFSEVVKRALNDGPQEITVRGEPAVVVLTRTEYERLVKPRPSLVELLRSSPLAKWDLEGDLDLERDHSPTRDVLL